MITPSQAAAEQAVRVLATLRGQHIETDWTGILHDDNCKLHGKSSSYSGARVDGLPGRWLRFDTSARQSEDVNKDPDRPLRIRFESSHH